jgi:hypothetical protein
MGPWMMLTFLRPAVPSSAWTWATMSRTSPANSPIVNSSPGLVRVHERDEAVDEVVDVLERARLVSVAVHGHVLAPQRLDDKVGDDAAVEGVHCGRVVGESSCNVCDMHLLRGP